MIRRAAKWSFVAIFQIVTLCSVTMAEDGSNPLEGKIIGGNRADITDFPHAVYLNLDCRSDSTTGLCGSSVINQVILLTAAHCLLCEKNEPVLTAFAGANDWTRAQYRQTGAARKVYEIMRHPQYKAETSENDIGLVILNEELPLYYKIKRVILPYRFPKFTDKTKAYVAGWGNFQEKPFERRRDWLKSVEVPLPINCPYWFARRVYPGMMCAGTDNNYDDRPAKGDSGSALITSNYQQLGLVSWRGPQLAMVVYTNVTYFYRWIKKAAKQLYCKTPPPRTTSIFDWTITTLSHTRGVITSS